MRFGNFNTRTRSEGFCNLLYCVLDSFWIVCVLFASVAFYSTNCDLINVAPHPRACACLPSAFFFIPFVCRLWFVMRSTQQMQRSEMFVQQAKEGGTLPVRGRPRLVSVEAAAAAKAQQAGTCASSVLVERRDCLCALKCARRNSEAQARRNRSQSQRARGIAG